MKNDWNVKLQKYELILDDGTIILSNSIMDVQPPKKVAKKDE